MNDVRDTTAADIMTEDPMTADLHARVQDAVEILQTLEIRHLPITDDYGGLVGMVSDRDLRNAARPYTVGESAGGPRRSLLEQPITEIMTSDVSSISPSATISEITDALLELKIGALPVVDDATGNLLGIVSYVDVLRALRKSIE